MSADPAPVRPGVLGSHSKVLLGACFFVSGATGLVLEVAWTKELSYILGNSLYAVATVVAAYMAGLGIGSALAGRLVHRVGNPIRVYGLLQLGIALCGLTLIHLFRGTEPLFAPLYRSTGGALFLAVRFLAVFVLLLPPTILMGMTLPVVVGSWARRRHAYDLEAGLVYGINTLGAVLGTLAAGFVLVPALGLWRTCLTAALVDLAVAAAGFLLARRVGSIVDIRREESAAVRAAGRDVSEGGPEGWTRRQWIVAGLYGVSGLIALTYEVAWFRLLGLTMGPTVYAFAAMLGVYLAGVGLGSALAASWAGRTRLGGLGAMALLEGALGLVSLLQLFFFNSLPQTYVRAFRWGILHLGEESFPFSLVLLSALVVFVPCLLLGALFPVAVRAVREAGREIAPEAHVGRVYLLNTAGAILGSLCTGFWWIPALRTWATLKLAGAASLALAAALVALNPVPGRRRRWILSSALVTSGALLLLLLPKWDEGLFNLGLYQGAYTGSPQSAVSIQKNELIFFREGLNAPVAVYRSYGNAVLYVSGKPDASLISGDLYTQLFVGLLPVALSPHPRKAAILGYGSGTSAAAVLAHSEVERLDVIEIERAVIEASPFFEPVNRNPFRDPRTRLILEDGRTHFTYARDRYDVIASEPSNPWMAGIASLYTRDYFHKVRAHLTPGGVFAQWIQDYDISEESFQSLLAGLRDAFPHLILFRPRPGDMLVVASAEPLAVPWATFRARFEQGPVQDLCRRVGLVHPLQVGFFFQGSETGVRRFAAGGAPWNTDDNCLLEYRLPRELMRSAAGSRDAIPVGIKLARAGADTRLSGLRHLFPGLPEEECLQEIVVYPHGLEPDPTLPQVSADLWWESRDILLRGLQAELTREGRGSLADSIAGWDQMGQTYRVRREQVTEKLRDLTRGAVKPEPALFQWVLEEAPDLPYTQTALGYQMMRLGRMKEAEEYLRAALETPTGLAYYEALVGMARLSLLRGRTEEAGGWCRQAIAWNPYYPRAFILLAQTLRKEGLEGEAVAVITRGLSCNPGDRELLQLKRGDAGG